MTALALAVRRRRWDLASLYLLLALAEAAAELSPAAFEALLDLLAHEDAPRSGRRP
ncbi:MAG TPA: hypothetical protein VNN12_02995 [Dehalococcoidia bacterium]|jgi:hypothetical protein|nr:hypothetical protein [Dehalococcoidia bacterium]